MTNQHGTGNPTDPRLDWLHERQQQAYELLTTFQEGSVTHYFGHAWNGRRVPLTEQQAQQARRAGVGIELPDTALLTAKDGE